MTTTDPHPAAGMESLTIGSLTRIVELAADYASDRYGRSSQEFDSRTFFTRTPADMAISWVEAAYLDEDGDLILTVSADQKWREAAVAGHPVWVGVPDAEGGQVVYRWQPPETKGKWVPA